MKLYQLIRSFAKDVLVYIYQKWLLRKNASILMYHSVSEKNYFFAVRPKDFEYQMRYLHEGRYNVISLQELIDLYVKDKKIPKKTVVITFDDGYEDNYSNAFRVIERYGFPITIFLTTGMVGSSKIHKNKETFHYLSTEQIQEMHRSSLVDFEPHGEMHYKLSSLAGEGLSKEIENSKEYIEHLLKKTCRVYCFAYGDYSEVVLKEVAKRFDFGVSVNAGFCSEVDLSQNKLLLPRNSVDSLVNNLRFKLKV